MIFDKQFFLKNQQLLRWFSNTRYGKDLLGHGLDRVDLILPNAVYKKEGKVYTAEFRTSDKYTKRIATEFKVIGKAFHWFDEHIANIYVPKLNLGFDTFPDIFSAAGDGSMRYHDGTSTWSQIRSQTSGTNVYGTDATSQGCGSQNTDRLYLYRSFFPFDTSSLPDDATIQTGTKLSIYATAKNDSGGTSLGLIQTTQASTSTLAAGDYDNLTVDTPNEGCTRVAISAITTSAYNDFTMNSTGLGWVSKTGNTLLGLRNSDDIDNSAPGGGETNTITHANSEQTGTTNDPKLVVIYTIPGGFFYLSQ